MEFYVQHQYRPGYLTNVESNILLLIQAVFPIQLTIHYNPCIYEFNFCSLTSYDGIFSTTVFKNEKFKHT
jgi:hypothetical protein